MRSHPLPKTVRFGINMGDDPEAHGCSVDEDHGHIYLCSEVSRHHPDIETYAVFSIEETGVSVVKGIGHTQDNDKYGISIRGKIDKIANQLAIKYGEWSVHRDRIRSSGIWDDADEWARSVRQGERSYYYIWELEDNDITDIYIGAKALGFDETYLVVEFLFSNKERFDEIRDNQGAEAF